MNTVVIGNFDGVHPGHQAVLAEARRRRPDLPLIVVTFWPHPVSVLHPDAPPMLLTSLEGRIELLQDAGADRVEVVRFTKEFAAWSPQRFVSEIVLPLEPALVVVGENFRFGAQAAGSVATLRELSGGRFEVVGLPLVGFGDEETCSTRIRQALQAGDVAHAAKHLGRPFRFRGVVAHGDQRGRTLGFPTANLPVPALRACPADGVYAGRVWRLDTESEPEHWPAAISVGSNPTFDGVQRRVESYVLDRVDLELYDVPIMVEFVDRIRGQIRFGSKDELVEQLKADVAATREILATR
ncbi:MAG: bifunctional riboflavin kinase/FAD synthetase [Propionibacteriaceae bacterium]|jgi:riboflavin kinase/FMN adenylyltransferase|nr:bifunctional riboflavin kinase/FAD synthetase [Propionibacteriaceae bacterium]